MPRLLRSRTRQAKLLSLLMVCAFLLSSCFHVDRDVKLNGDGSGSYTLDIGLTEAVVGLAGSTFTNAMDERGKQFKQQGGDYRHFDRDGYSVWEFTRPFKSTAELNTLLQQNPMSSNDTSGNIPVPAQSSDTLSVSEDPGFFVNTFHVTGHISLKDLNGTSSTSVGGVDLSSYLKDARDSVTISMPGWITSHSAGGVVNGNTVTYTAHYNEEATIDVTGGAINPTALFLAAGIGLLVVLVVVGVVVWRLRRSRRASDPALVPAGPASYAPPPDAPTL